MEKINWLFIVFGVTLILAASFSLGDIKTSPPSLLEPSDFQLIIAIGGLVAIIVGIIKS